MAWKFYFYLGDQYTEDSAVRRLFSVVAKYYGGGAPLPWLNEQPMNIVTSLYDEMRWQQNEEHKAFMRSQRGF